MKKSLLVLLSVFLSLILFSCATSTGDKPRAEIGGEITLVGTTPGVEMKIKIPFDSEKKEETTEKKGFFAWIKSLLGID